MAVITKKTLQLKFATESGKELNLTINAPKDNLDGATISAAMNQIIASGAIGDENVVTSKVDAQYIMQSVEAISLA